MITVLHKAEERGGVDYEWLHSRYSFSFADWYEPSRMGFGVLRAINDDTIKPHSGFGEHSHTDMEIVTIVSEGAVSHHDNMGGNYKAPAGSVQIMSAGTGVVHSEHNYEDSPLKLFQIWIAPRTKGVVPRYDQRSFDPVEKNKVQLLVSGNKTDDALYINQDAYVSRIVLDEGKQVTYALNHELNSIYIFVAEGRVRVADYDLAPRDAIGIIDPKEILISAITPAEVLIFEVPMQ